MKYKAIWQISLLFAVIFLATPLYAACTIDSVSNQNLNFTRINLTNYYLADITVSCDVNYQLGIDAGQHLAGSRQLLGSVSGNTISYTLYQGSTTTEWGSQGLAAPNLYSALPLASSSGTSTYQIYADVSLQGNSPPGTYTDTVNIILANSVGATIATTSLHFNPTLASFCTLDTSSFNGDFGTYPQGSANLTNVALGSIAATCPSGVSYAIGINGGQHLSGKRHMALNTHFIPYTIKHSGNEWGDSGLTIIEASYQETFPAALAVSATGTGSAQTFSISGDAEIQNATSTGTYTDTLTVTLVW